jgi:hypothetical protein
MIVKLQESRKIEPSRNRTSILYKNIDDWMGG